MPQLDKPEAVKAVTGVAKARVHLVVKAFVSRRAISVQAWKEAAPKRTWTVRAVFVGEG